MADPYSAAALGTFQLINGLQQADMIRRQGELNQIVYDINQKYAEADAWEALKQGISEEARYTGRVRQVLASQRAILAAKNVDANFGTMAEIRAENELTGYLNQISIRNQTSAKVLGYKRQALNYGIQGAMNRSATEGRASATQAAGFVRGVGSFASGYSFGSSSAPESNTAVSPRASQQPIDYNF